MKTLTSAFIFLFIAGVHATTPCLGVLATNIEIPLCIQGKTVGSISLKTGQEITILKIDSDGILISRGEYSPVKVSKETITSDSIANAEATPRPTPFVVSTPKPTQKALQIKNTNTSENVSQVSSNSDALVGTWMNLKNGFYRGAVSYTIKIQSMGSIFITQEFSTGDH